MTDLTACPRCKALLDPSDTFCRECGTPSPDAPTVASDTFPVGPSIASGDSVVTELRDALAPGIQLLRELGRGGMGIVFLGRDAALHRLVVIKVLLPELARDATARARFAREAESAAAVSHPNVVSIYQVGALPTSGVTYFVMQFVDGPTVQQAFPEGRAAPLPRVRRLLGEVASALAAAHARGLIHRDIKPSNVMLETESGRVVVLDFGISAARGASALAQSQKLTLQGTSIGTPEYMSPEQGAGETVTEKSDVYSLGVMGFELLTGRLPFRDQSAMALVAAHIKDSPPLVASLRPDLDPQLADLVDRCLAKAAEERPAAEHISRLLLPSAHPLIEWPPPGLEQLRGLAVKLLSALAVMVSAAAGFFLLLLRTPIAMSPAGLNRWFSEHGATNPTSDFSGLPIWFFVLTIFSTVILLLIPVVAARGWRLATLLHRARHDGYPWRVLLDTASDGRDDTGALLNGSGRFALLESHARDRLMRRRRARVAVGGATIMTAMTLMSMWVVGWTGGWATGPGLLPAPEAAVLLGPVVLGLLVVSWLGRLESRLVGSDLGRRFGWRVRQVGSRPELVRSWLDSARNPAAMNSHRAWLAALSVVPVLVASVLVVAGGIVFFVASIAASNGARSTEAALTIVGTLTTDSLRTTTWREYDSLFALSSQVRGAGTTVDSAAAKRLVGWQYAGANVPSYRNAATIGSAVTPPARWNGDLRKLASVTGPASFDSAIAPHLAQLAADTTTPVLALFRSLARSGPLPPLLLLRVGLPGPDMPGRLYQFQGYDDAALLNVSAGILALRQRDSAAAMLRAREIIAIARHMMRSPLLFDHLRGLNMSGSGTFLIQLTGRVMRDPALVAEAERLRVLRARARADFTPWWTGGAQLLMADPVGPVLLRFLSDTTLLPAARAAAAAGVVSGFCLSAREILFGVDPRRREALDGVGTALQNTPRMGDIILAERRELDDWIASPSTASARYADMFASVNMWYGPPIRLVAPLLGVGRLGVTKRIAFCWGPWRNLGYLVQ